MMVKKTLPFFNDGWFYFMFELGARLREERQRLKLSQVVLAKEVAVSKPTMIAWEKGNTSPTAVQMSRMSELGFDVLYVLTGQRVFEESDLSRDEAALLDNYRHLDDADKKSIQRVSSAMAFVPGENGDLSAGTG